jgi:thiamine biosynthesis lipoprotein
LILNRHEQTLRFLLPGMQLDFGGLAKGYAAQRVAQVLEAEGVPSGLVNLGQSTLTATRCNPKSRSTDELDSTASPKQWLIAIRHPDATSDEHATGLALFPGLSVTTSGTYEREFLVDGTTFSHLIHPHTGRPLIGRRSATLVSRSALRGEVLAKKQLFAELGGQPSPNSHVFFDVKAEAGLVSDDRDQQSQSKLNALTGSFIALLSSPGVIGQTQER